MVAPHKVWIPGGTLWPSEIAAHYEWVGSVVRKYNGLSALSACLTVEGWKRLKEITTEPLGT
jgi:hypothetical protein